ncbi:MAG TPA: rhomboid family intramembrane serine protease [Gemmatimonadaceae bacterium]|jgi:membrane associated rhomboid family serine protease|nr:rhomboid family intramembrane serine protease [Gemmatimonadaceae bacterium]
MAIPTLYDDADRPRMTRSVQVMLAINVAMLFLQWAVVSDADAFAVLAFQAGSLQRTLWSAVTYMFVHYGALHLALNMYALLAFGPRLEAAMGTRAFTLYYLWCGLGGAVAHMLFVQQGLLIGASAGVLGVMFAYWQHWPDEQVSLFGVIPVRSWTAIVLLGGAILALGAVGAGAPVAGGAQIAYAAHIGGIAFAWLYMRTPPAASIERLRQRISPAPDYPHDETPRAIPRTLPRARAQRDEVDEIVAKSKAVAAQQQQRPVTRAVATPLPPAPQGDEPAELDRVLDKISLRGLESLTATERAVLDESARRLRGEGR